MTLMLPPIPGHRGTPRPRGHLSSIPPIGILALALVLSPPPPATSQEGEPGASPFAGVETHYLSNGMKVWFQRMPGDPDFYANVMVPYGFDSDFQGKEEIAHFLEHMLFSDHMGRTEEEIKREIEDRGGRRNGMTSSDRTLYYVAIQKEHGLLALDWLYRVVSPHEMDPEVVERGRQPVALEIGARPREFFDWIGAYVVDPPWLRTKGFWEKEFGLETRQYRWYDRYASLQAITPQDLRDFYDTYYVPSRMTLLVVGDLDRDSVMAQAEATFGTLPPRPAPEVPPELTDPGRHRRSFAWSFRPNVLYDTRFKLYELAATEHLQTLFIQDMLLYRLNQRLRYGERKAIYGVSVRLVLRGPAAYFQIYARINEEEWEFAREVIQEELDYLRNGTLPPVDFEQVRQTLVTRLNREFRRPEALGSMAGMRFYHPDRHAAFPDLAQAYREVSQEDLATLAQGLFAQERRVHRVVYRQPVSQGAMALAGILLVALSVSLARAALISPVEMPRIRYVARFKRSFPARVVGAVAVALVLAALYRLGAHGVELIWDGFVAPIPSYLIQHAFMGSVVALGILGVILALASIPHKLMVFDDHLLIKYRAYRSRSIGLDEISSLETERTAGFLKRGGPRNFRTLTLGLLRPGVLLETTRGRGYFFRVRDGEELMRTIEELREKPEPAEGEAT